MTKIFEETIQKIDEEMYCIHKIIKQTEGSTFKAEQPVLSEPNGKKQKAKSKLTKSSSNPPPTTEFKKQKKNDIKTTESVTPLPRIRDLFESLPRILSVQPLKPLQPLLPAPEDPIEDITNTMRFLGLSPLDANNQDIVNSDKELTSLAKEQ